MKDKGFVSLVALIWFSAILLFIHQALMTMQQYLLAYENMDFLIKRSLIEMEVAARSLRMWSEFEEEDYCDFIDDCEVCWDFHNLSVTVSIEYENSQESLLIDYDSDCDCLIDIQRKVDK